MLKGLRAERAAAARYRAATQESLIARLRVTKLFAVHSGATLTVTNVPDVGCVGGGRLAAQGEISIELTRDLHPDLDVPR